MVEFAIYLLKSSGILLLFWCTYCLFLQRETTFSENRLFLILGILTAALLPFLKLKRTVSLQLVPTQDNGESITNVLPLDPTLPTWVFLLLFIYILGCFFFLIRFLIQLKSMKRLYKNGRTWQEDDLLHVETREKIAPFSFFKSLFYNPNQFHKNELEAILAHEKVHARDWHSVDVLLAELLKVLLWFNPLIWIYQKKVQQNLEFLADAKAIHTFNRKSYQYLMVNQATGYQFSITNSFYNSLIKKRIVMLNKNQSKQMKALKSLIVLPFLVVFLVGFNTETVYQFPNENSPNGVEPYKKVELIINKDTSDDELREMKKTLAEDDVDFSYTTVRNDNREIIDISLHVSGIGKNGAAFNNSHNTSDTKNGISPLFILVDVENNLVSIGSKGAYKSQTTNVFTNKNRVWVSTGDDKPKEVVIKKEDGVSKVFINGEEVDESELQEHDIQVHVDEDHDESVHMYISVDADENAKKPYKISKHKAKNGKQVMVVKDSDDDSDIEVLSGDNGFFYVDTDGKEPLYVINGKESSKKEVKQLSPDEVESVNVLKGKAATKKYGRKAKNGVVEFTTKAKN
ncbi:M56 family peptidase [Muricauda sp. SCSIO 64092]|uniref:M56 family metallopeptidase n=1 Tax=Allomuricauda sp. SCSIO 64092 TaxID=2908842 RepID=UPI001FF1C206|nr:M56 family metallopeptidase [Muricauda sp. SCSIO 64092]UOY05505.1 M56 family peptidase [Muricauda sp. SCSIO 64092]